LIVSIAVAAAIIISVVLQRCGICLRLRHFECAGPASEMYTLSMGHMDDLTLSSFAYLRLPLIVAGIAAVIAL